MNGEYFKNIKLFIAIWNYCVYSKNVWLKVGSVCVIKNLADDFLLKTYFEGLVKWFNHLNTHFFLIYQF